MESKSPEYDVVIIGSGVAGALCASRLVDTKARILILEAGDNGLGGFQREQFHRVWEVALTKSWNTPYLESPNRNYYPSPGNNDVMYFDQKDTSTNGTGLFKGYYQRMLGGTTWSWRGNTPRMIPNDFRLKSVYGLNDVPDWPISYDDLEHWYCDAEYELGVSGDNDEWNGLLGASRSRQFPMPAIVKSFSDQLAIKALGHADITLGGQRYHPKHISTPQARNSRPYDGRPACEGNNNCIPLCPIGAKYDASIHLRRALQQGVHLRSGCVVSKLEAHPQSGLITKVLFKDWKSSQPEKDCEVTARLVILAANAIESPKILLMSGLATKSDQVGRNLMDHIQGEVVAVFPEPVYPFRGPQSITGIEVFRDGPFRSEHAAFRMTLGNDGWGRAGNATTVLNELLNDSDANEFHFGEDLKNRLVEKATSLVRFGFSTEQLPYSTNRVRLSTQTDDLGLPRPKIEYSVDKEYTVKALEAGHAVATEIFTKMKAKVDEQHSQLWKDGKLQWNTAAHIMGTCRMGTNTADSVVDSFGRCHEHPNLFLVGSSVFPTGSTANPTLTIAALALRTTQAVRSSLIQD
jgi:choline dehydrogenase-like flavoprotein